MSLRNDRSRSVFSRRASTALVAFAVGAVGGLPLVARAQQAPARPATHTVKRGDTLWDISKLYLGDPFLWPEIYRINTDLIEDPHWIYPGEVLKLPTTSDRVVAEAPAARVSPPASTAPAPVRPAATPIISAPAPRDTAPTVAPEPVRPVRMGEYIASPWVDKKGGPAGSGSVLRNRNLSGIASADHSRMNLYDPVLVAPPTNSDAPEHTRYLTYRLGPDIEGFGQIVIPTGIVEITRSAQNGEAAIGRVTKLFDEMLQGQRLIPFDSAAALVASRPVAVANGRSGKVRWVRSSPVLPSIQNYFVVDIPRSDVSTGDQIELYKPRQKPVEPTDLATPEVLIARAQVLRVTEFGATAIITSHEQPRIEEGTSARVAAKMP
jgi:LysM repeat protein